MVKVTLALLPSPSGETLYNYSKGGEDFGVQFIIIV